MEMTQVKVSYAFTHTQYRDVSFFRRGRAVIGERSEVVVVDGERFKTKMRFSDLPGLMWT